MASWSIEGKKSRVRLHVVRKMFAVASKRTMTGLSLKQLEQGIREPQIESMSTMSAQDDTYWKKLVDRVREGLRPDFQAGTEHTSAEILKVRRQVKRRLDKTDSSLAALQSSVDALHSSLGDIKKNLER